MTSKGVLILDGQSSGVGGKAVKRQSTMTLRA
jgi:hypothetical protein